MQGFFEFIREQGVIGLAVGFLLGGSVSRLVQSLANDIVTPLVGIVIGSKESLQESSITISSATLQTGNFFATMIDFVTIAFIVYFVVKRMGIDRLDKKKN